MLPCPEYDSTRPYRRLRKKSRPGRYIDGHGCSGLAVHSPARNGEGGLESAGRRLAILDGQGCCRLRKLSGARCGGR